MEETLGERLKRLRTERGYSAAQLGSKAGIGENALFKIEAGITKQPTFVTGIRLARALGVQVDELAFGKGKLPPETRSIDGRLAAVEEELPDLHEGLATVNETLGNIVALLRDRGVDLRPPAPPRARR